MSDSALNNDKTWNIYGNYNGFTYLVARGVDEEYKDTVENGDVTGNYSCVLNPAKNRGGNPADETSMSGESIDEGSKFVMLGRISKSGDSFYIDLPTNTKIADIISTQCIPYKKGRRPIIMKEMTEGICSICGFNYEIEYTKDDRYNILKICSCGECER